MLAEIIPSHKVATWLLNTIDSFLDSIGLEKDKTIEEIIYVAAIVGFALLIGWLVRKGILFIVRKIVQTSKSEVSHEILQHRIPTKCSHVIPPLVILGLLPFAFDHQSVLLHAFQICLYIYTFIIIAIAVNTVLTFIWQRYNTHENAKNLPLKGILNVCKGIVWIIVVIISIAALIDKSPVALLTGLGAFAAVLTLVFKDTILGFVAGIQLSQNDMLHVGDWIVVPSTIANGIVIDVSLTAVKVQNWDNTIVTCPPYTLVSTSFQNWRGMSASGCRQICRAVIFDSYYIKPCDDELIANIVAKYPQMKPFVDKTRQNDKPTYDPGLAVVNGTLETNLGLFRAYMCQYLLNHPQIRTDQQILVRVMVPTGVGIPLQIWCFTTTAWTAYEAVQSEIFEHIAAVCQDFGLQLFNYPSGVDVDTFKMVDEQGKVIGATSSADASGAAAQSSDAVDSAN
ncbi:MAG: mechanosensitive ion channel [Bacteroides sp.]|nr:mechanosensitive ion channel [Bacteroides sp.]